MANGGVSVGIFPSTMPTQRVHHYSFDMQYDLGHNYVMSLGYQGSLSRDLFFHENPLAVPATSGYALNPQISGGDYWGASGRANYNAMLAELKHQFSHQFMADVQYTWSKSMDIDSAPYSEQLYPYDLNLNYGRSDYNVTNSFKTFGMWQPVFFHGSNGWLEKIAGGWSLSGIWNWHSGFPWTPFVSVQTPLEASTADSAATGNCSLRHTWAARAAAPATKPSRAMLAQTIRTAGPHFAQTPQCSVTITTNCYTDYHGATSGTALPPDPGVARNSLNLPGYKDVDLTLTKGFGSAENAGARRRCQD